jgi:hypothetical protein
MTKWEYRVLDLLEVKAGSTTEVQQVLNGLGQQGWEVVAVGTRDSGTIRTFILKRPNPA